jgi:hypothetical protein
MRAQKLIHATSARVTGHLLLILVAVLTIFAQPIHCEAQQTQAPNLVDVQPFSENTPRRPRRTESIPTAIEVARTARFIYVHSLSALVTAEDIENKMRRHPDFQRLGLVLTRQGADADLILEVRRSVLTKFVFVAIAPESLIIVASGKLSSLGGTVDAKVAKLFMKQLVTARQ